MTTPLVRMSGITKRFGPVTVLEDVSFEIRAGEVHILAGENGAGKSTLIKILAGVHRDYQGTIQLDGRPVRPRSPTEAGSLGIAVIHQELSLVPSMTIADNVLLGRWPTRAGLVLGRVERAEARRSLAIVGLDMDVDQRVEQLPIGTQQLIEIAKALSQRARVLVMDEPTSALSSPEVATLFDLIGQLKRQGCGIVYITHKMEEIEQIGDRVTVLRDGRTIGTANRADLPIPKLIHWMVGREIDQQLPRHQPHLGRTRLQVADFSVFPRGLGTKSAVERVGLSVRSGEIVGIGGLQGSGASELLWGLFGAYGVRAEGRVELDGKLVRIRSPRQAIQSGVALLTNDRKASGLILPMSIVANATLADLPNLTWAGWRRPRRELAVTAAVTGPLNLRAVSLDAPVATLSGGTQQKVALAKWLQTRPLVLLLDAPTRGIDVGAKREIYALMNQWTQQGIAIILISSEMPELLAMSDRIVVMHRGRVTAEMAGNEATADRILEAAMGHGGLKNAGGGG
jgi:ribose transport system ATP-binding protein